VTKSELENAMRDHVLEKAELVGTYERTKIGATKAGAKTETGAK
jgi:hypothetical protein